MPVVYNPVEVELTTISLPVAGEPRSSASLRGPCEDLADAIKYSDGRAAAIAAAPTVYIAAGPTIWTPASPYVKMIRFMGWGAGGGGGGGGYGAPAVNTYSSSGAGGGAAMRQWIDIPVTYGVAYEILIGVGGGGGTGGVFTGPVEPTGGGPGGDTIFRVQGGAVLATFKGAKAGYQAYIIDADYPIAPGGTPVAMQRAYPILSTFPDCTFCFGPGFGGDGVSSAPLQYSRTGAASIEGHAGGAGGIFGVGSTPGGYYGGAGGGGGAAGPGGVGGPGGGGGWAATSLNDHVGGGGDSGYDMSGEPYTTGAFLLDPNNTGAGGGGGGAGGCYAAGGGDGGNGQPGAHGYAEISVIG